MNLSLPLPLLLPNIPAVPLSMPQLAETAPMSLPGRFEAMLDQQQASGNAAPVSMASDNSAPDCNGLPQLQSSSKMEHTIEQTQKSFPALAEMVELDCTSEAGGADDEGKELASQLTADAILPDAAAPAAYVLPSTREAPSETGRAAEAARLVRSVEQRTAATAMDRPPRFENPASPLPEALPTPKDRSVGNQALPIGPGTAANADKVQIHAQPQIPQNAFQLYGLPQIGESSPVAPSVDLGSRNWVGSLGREIVAAHKQAGELSLQLSPTHLGRLDIALVEAPSGLTVELRTESREAAQIIVREEPRLLAELRQSGVAVADCFTHFGASDDGRQHRNGSIPHSFLPYEDSDRASVQDQDQGRVPSRGRFA